MEAYGIHWFRRDLRVQGNPALQWNWKEHKGRVLGFFCFDKKFLERPDFSIDRFGFFLESLKELRSELTRLGSSLLVLDIGPEQAFEQLFDAINHKSLLFPQTITCNRDYEPFARARDQKIQALIEKRFGLKFHSERDHLLVEPEELRKEDGDFYKVFTPFARKWLQLIQSDKIRARVNAQRKSLEISDQASDKVFQLTWKSLFGDSFSLEDVFDKYYSENKQRLTIQIPKAGYRVALEKVKSFSGTKLLGYAEQRDFPSQDGTSQLSIFFKNGTITTSQVIAALQLQTENINQKDGVTTYLKEIIWREFYYHILFHCPHVENVAFNPKFQNLDWENNEKFFASWKTGTTGYPIVDAGMRQLNATGWMHNRVRMIVASFLTKDLLINWQWGERYFMEKLLDGDLAPNNGGWQWAASTGCDPQPYFRIFNPVLQGKKFDPDGKYVKTWIPELRNVPEKYIHEPWLSQQATKYEPPIVDHQTQKTKALRMYDQGE